MTSGTLPLHHGLWRIEVRPTYRQVIAAGVVAAMFAYVLLIYPLGYYGQFVAADAVGPGVVQEASPSLLSRIFFPLAALLSVTMYVLERHRAAPISLIATAPLALFVAYSGLSSIWALDPATSISKVIVLGLVLTAIIPAATVVDSVDRYLKPMFWVAVATLLINLAFVLFTTPTAIGAAGIYSHKNSLGSATAVCAMFMFYGLAQPGKLYKTVGLTMFPIVFFILFLSQSKTSLALTLVVPFLAGGFTLARYYFRLPMTLLLGLLAIVVSFVLLSGIVDFSMIEISEALTGDPTFTGRTDLWSFAVEKIAERPWFGYGFHSFWQIGDDSPAWAGVRGFLQRTPHAHEGYLDLVLEGGFVGLGLFILMLITVGNWISRITDESAAVGYFATASLLLMLLLNALETTWFNPLEPSTTLFAVFLASAMGRLTVKPRGQILGVRL